jgi:hypothetical protein
MRRVAGLAVAGLLAVSALGGMPAAFASPAGTRAVTPTFTGACSGPSTWILTLKTDGSQIESDLEVQSPAAGQLWRFKMKDNGVKFAQGHKVTRRDGSFSVTRFAPDQPGTDNIVARAVNQVTAEVCVATGSI